MSDLRPTESTDAPVRTPPVRPLPAGRGGQQQTIEKLRPWALRQASRTYGHLPEADRAGAVDAALQDIAGRGVADDARAARFAVADTLTQRLRAAHVTWCHRPGAVDAPPTTPDAPATVADVVERGLGGLERAVLQLEIGAGRDTRTSRAALRLSPRDYARHRREGLAKVRAAVDGQVAGHVCAGHAADVVLAATGDDAAQERLGVGRDRCRACAREAHGLRRLLHQRLGLAPWPLEIKPMGILAAKLAGLGGAAGATTIAGGSAATGSGLLGGAGGVVATVASVMAVAGGTFAVVESRGDEARPAAAATPAAQTVSETVVARRTATPAPTAAARQTATPKPQRAATGKRTEQRTAAPAPAATTAPAGSGAPATASATAAASPAAAAPATASKPAPSVGDTATKVTDAVEQVTAPVTGALPAPVGDAVQDTVTGVGDVVQGVGATADGLLTP